MSSHFHKLSIAKITKEASKTVAITFAVPENLKSEYKFIAGQYLTLRADVNNEDIRRSYSICSSPNSGELTVAVKAIENGKFSNYAYDNLKEGDEMDVMTPTGNFVLSSSANHHVFMAAGSGITPVLSMIKAILESGSGKATLFYANRSAAETIFKGELDALSANNENLKVNYVLTREETGNPIFNGRIDKAKCASFHSDVLGGQSIDALYLCGPEEMINNAKEYFLGAGVSSDKIHFELFTSPLVNAKVVPDVPVINVNSQVTVIIDDEEYEFSLNTDDKDVLQAAMDMGADVPFSCKGGVCCTCRAKILEGTAKMDLNFSLEESEIEEGFILTCQAHPTSENLVVSFDEY